MHEVNLILAHAEYENEHAAEGRVPDGQTALAELLKRPAVLGHMRFTSSRPGGTVPKCNDE
jgi:hypothetical protein